MRVTIDNLIANEAACSAAIDCVLFTLLRHVMVLLLLSVPFVAVFPRLKEAKAIVLEERRRAVAERDAFGAFADRVASLTPSDPVPTAGPTTTMIDTRGGRGSDDVVDAYEETVLATAHYDEEYDESVEVNMAAELGEEVAMAVLEQGELTRPVQQTLEAKARISRQLRVEFVSTLDDEYDSVETAESEFEDLLGTLESLDRIPLSDRSFDELRDLWYRVDELESSAEQLLNDRQDYVHRTNTKLGIRETFAQDTVQEYLYEPMDTTFPVLSEGMALLRTTRDARLAVSRSLAARG